MTTWQSAAMSPAIAAAQHSAIVASGFTSGRTDEAAAALVTGALAIAVGLRAKQPALNQPTLPQPEAQPEPLLPPAVPVGSAHPSRLPTLGPDPLGRPAIRRLGTAVLFGLAAGFLAPGAGPAMVFAAAGFTVGYVLAGRSAAARTARAAQRRIAAAPLAIELFAAGLHAGLLPEQAATAVVEAFGQPGQTSVPPANPASDQSPLTQVAERFREAAAILGATADPALAWTALRQDPATEPVGTAALRSSRTGAPLAEAVSRAACATRTAAQQAAQGQVRAVAVKATAPLALCFLPAFVLIGILPMALGLLHEFQQ